MALLRFLVFLASLLSTIALSRAATAQPKPAAPAPAVERAADEEATDSPRASMRAYFDLAERGRYQEASVYLDLPRGAEKRGAELATKLHAVLSQRLLVNPEQLSPLATGRPTDGLPAGVEELGKVTDAKGRAVAIRLVRHESRSSDDEPRWVFSQSTVSHVDQLYGALRDRWIRERLPSYLLVQGPLALLYWQWLAIPLGAVACFFLGHGLGWISGLLATRVLAGRPWGARLLSGLKSPVRLGWSIVAFALMLPTMALTLRAEDIMERGLRAIAYLTFFWALLRVVILVGDELTRADWAAASPSARSLSSIGVSLGKVIVAALALMVALSELGYPVTSVIAGLGIGGIALALAAQKTVENLFGSISILADRPFRVGDAIRVDTIEGVVERVGLRSTRVRTVDRTLIVFPNGKLADMRIETFGPRDRIRFATKLALSRATSTAQLKEIVERLPRRLAEHESTRKEDISVRLIAIGEGSYDVEVVAPVETLDAAEFARIREELLVLCIEMVEAVGTRLAVPTRELLPTRGLPVGAV